MLDVGIVASVLNHLAEQLHHFLPRGIALFVNGSGSIGKKHREGSQPLIQIVVQFRNFLKQIFPHIISVEAATGSKNGQLRKRMKKVYFSTVPPRLEILPRFLLDFGSVPLETGGAKSIGHGLELHLSVFFGGVVDDPCPEDGFHKAVDFVLGEDFVGGFEEWFLGLGADEEGESFVEERNSKNRTILIVTALHHLHRTFTKFNNRPNDGNAAHWTRRHDGRSGGSSLGSRT
mmetsp:Transcript_4353/g.9860  ORF Transcript_4353/g.9860 Transcript_4353/m.9860 type:complete len:232 (-) Transcript_4353:180-875(-)